MSQYIRVKYKDERHFAIVDDIDFDRLRVFKWYLRKSKNKLYATRYLKVGRKIFNKGRKKYRMQYMHHDILECPDGYEVDHKDNNGLNCTRDNLRLATHAQNMSNRIGAPNSASIYKGVSRKRDKWRARIKKNGKELSLGSFFTAYEAARAYDTAAIEIHGEYAYLNFKIQ